jgi:two-component sensor histidine kinase
MTTNPFSSLVREPEPVALQLGTERRRAKNTLQVVASLLALQSRETSDPVSRAWFAAAESRARVIAQLYDRLARSGPSVLLDFSEALRDIVAETIRQEAKSNVSFQVFADPLQLDLETAIPAGLIAHELLSDALANAFGDRPAGHMEVSLRLSASGTEAILTVGDDGDSRSPLVHVATDAVRPKLVDVLLRQLRARLSLESISGTRLVVRFPLTS